MSKSVSMPSSSIRGSGHTFDARAMWKKAGMMTLAQIQLSRAVLPGRVYSWGANHCGQLGHGNSLHMDRPKLVDEYRGIVINAVALGGEFGIAVSDQGDVFSFGANAFGQLGTGEKVAEMHIPKRIEYLKSRKITSVACGEVHALALSEGGHVYSWGCGEQGQLGLGDVGTQLMPRMIEALKGKKIVGVACGAGHSAFITDSGHLYTCGWGEYGQLGLGDTGNQLAPRWVEILHGKRVTAVACGEVHTAAVTASGELYTWGCGEDGRLGHSIYGRAMFPAIVAGALQGKIVVNVACGDDFTVAITDVGEVYTFGRGQEGQLGIGSLKNAHTPTLVAGLKEKFVTNVDCGYKHTVVITDDEEIYTWGTSTAGGLGLGPGVSTVVEPMVVHSLKGRKIVKVYAGGQSCFAISGEPILLPSNVYACGEGKNGALGHSGPDDRLHLLPVDGMIGKKVVCASAGLSHTVACTENGEVYTWGVGLYGCLGHGDDTNKSSPTIVSNFKTKFKRIVHVCCGPTFTFAITDSGDVYSWGYNQNGELGHENRENINTPALIKALEGKGTTDIACGWNFCAALSDGGDIFMWGNNAFGQLGTGDYDERLSPTVLKWLVGKQISKVACGRSHACALTVTGEVYTWGQSNCGQLGHGDTKGSTQPRVVVDLRSLRVVEIACGSSHTMVVTEEGSLLTFGYGNSGRLGLGDSKDRYVPTLVESLNSIRIVKVFSSSTSFHSLALDASGKLYSWGHGKHGELSTGEAENVKIPYQILSTGHREIKTVACGGRHTVVITVPSVIRQRIVKTLPGFNPTSTSTFGGGGGLSSVSITPPKSVVLGGSSFLSPSKSPGASSLMSTATGLSVATPPIKDAQSFLQVAVGSVETDQDRADVKELQDEVAMMREKLNRMRLRNSELREEVQNVREVNNKLSGMDLEGLPVQELDDLRSTHVENVKRIFTIKQERLRDEIDVKERQQLEEVERVYSEVLKGVTAKYKTTMENVNGMREANEKMAEKITFLKQEIKRIQGELAAVDVLEESMGGLREEANGSKSVLDRLVAQMKSVEKEVGDEVEAQTYLVRRSKAIQEEHTQMGEEVKRTQAVRIKKQQKLNRDEFINGTIESLLSAAEQDPPPTSVVPASVTYADFQQLQAIHMFALKVLGEEIERRRPWRESVTSLSSSEKPRSSPFGGGLSAPWKRSTTSSQGGSTTGPL